MFSDLTDLQTLRQFVKDYEFNKSMDSSIGMYNMMLNLGFYGAETLMVSKMGIETMRGYAAFQQSKLNTDYAPLIVEMSSQSSIMSWFQKQPADVRLIMMILFQTLAFYMTPMMMGSMGFGPMKVGATGNGEAAPPRRMQPPSINPVSDLP